jgi:type III pantothenate kinase
MILLLDIGNTRIKWAHLEGDVLSSQSAAVHAEDRIQILERIGEGRPIPQRIVVSNVGGPEIGAACSRTLERRFGVPLEFVQSLSHQCGVTNAYREPAKLGVDRWLAMIAAYQMRRSAVCVVSVGTAMTVDGVDSTGQHLGGVIVAGPNLMVSSLLHNTSDIAARMTYGEPAKEVFADHTSGAVHQGCLHALAGLIDRTQAYMEVRMGTRAHLVVTGGAAAVLLPLIRPPSDLVDDLVLRGLALVVSPRPVADVPAS